MVVPDFIPIIAKLSFPDVVVGVKHHQSKGLGVLDESAVIGVGVGLEFEEGPAGDDEGVGMGGGFEGEEVENGFVVG